MVIQVARHYEKNDEEALTVINTFDYFMHVLDCVAKDDDDDVVRGAFMQQATDNLKSLDPTYPVNYYTPIGTGISFITTAIIAIANYDRLSQVLPMLKYNVC